MVLSVDALGDTQIAPAKDAKVTKEKKCVFPKSRKRAPIWICNAHTDGLAVTAVGSAVKSGAGISFMEQMAAADARVNLARDLRVSVQNKIKGSEDSTSKDAADQDGAIITKISNDSLQGTRIVKSAYGPNGTLYVLVGLDETSANKLIESISAEYLEQKRK
jgi:hypothetical protein